MSTRKKICPNTFGGQTEHNESVVTMTSSPTSSGGGCHSKTQKSTCYIPVLSLLYLNKK